MGPIALNSALDVAALQARLARDGRVHIPNILAPGCADAIHSALQAHSPWNVVALVAGQHRDFDLAGVETAPPEKVRQLLSAAHAGALSGFGYFYENYPVYDAWRRGELKSEPLEAVRGFLNGEAFLSFARQLTGMADIGYVDAQATRYRAGHFLTVHDDHLDKADRRAAYVLNLTKGWRPDWGGQLLFHDADGHVTGGFMPAFNALNVFFVPASHSVSVVAPYASGARYAVTGWMNGSEDSRPRS
jgi:Rps23 Pro-64 3,4-dihydroxylase Tpa1-like proline 4-hydroxylase